MYPMFKFVADNCLSAAANSLKIRVEREVIVTADWATPKVDARAFWRIVTKAVLLVLTSVPVGTTIET